MSHKTIPLVPLFLGLTMFPFSQEATETWPKVENLNTFTTYKTKLSRKDVAQIFGINVMRYLGISKYYNVYYTVYSEDTRQTYAWAYSERKYTFESGRVAYVINLSVSNGDFSIRFSNEKLNLTSGGETKEIASFAEGSPGQKEICADVTRQFLAFYNESSLMLKVHNELYTDLDEQAFSHIFSLLKR